MSVAFVSWMAFSVITAMAAPSYAFQVTLPDFKADTADSCVPDPQVLLRDTDWPSLQHAYPGPWDPRPQLTALLDPDPVVQAQALNNLEPVRHQNSTYEATAPVALYVAGILSDPRTASLVNVRTHPGTELRPRAFRAALLDWLGEVAYDADDSCVEMGRRHGFESYPAQEVLRSLRQVYFRAVAPFLTDADQEVRDSAAVAVVPMIEAPELAQHREALMPLLHRLLASSQDRWHRSRAVDACTAWGCHAHRQPGALGAPLQDAEPLFGNGGFREDPPF
ncbi:hypothetical protein [Kitasatospora sp. NBC_00315]|uniref:hypothetical protein n=1 Tax=Kitasatospora sp. NBC_00315 TaxID=2975963 RepID=UPI0032450734